MAMAERSSSSAPAPCPSCSFPQGKLHDVFLCFKGSDTRWGFTGHLYQALRRKGVVTFMDDEDFEWGRPIEHILKHLKDSRIAVVIFSENFAASTFCLRELATIRDCIDGKTQEVVPIFYKVDTSEPQSLPEESAYRKAFDKHRQNPDLVREKVDDWESAMKRVARISGKSLKKERKESEFIETFVRHILEKLKLLDFGFSSLTKSFIGRDEDMKNVRSYLDIVNGDVVRCIVISGSSGIGKTAIAQLLFAENYYKFDGSSFLSDVSNARGDKSDLVCLQKQLLSETLKDDKVEVLDLFRGMAEIKRRLCSMRVLVVLDDVDHIDQLKYLIGAYDDARWFGSGSRIIITTTRIKMPVILRSVEKETYEVKEGLTEFDALQLFYERAFGIGCDKPREGFEKLCEDFVEYADGFPLALDVIGSRLSEFERKEAWESELKRMKEDPPNEIVGKLQRILEGLNRSEKDIFLDIAFFFRGENEDSLKRVLESCQFYPDAGLEILKGRSLITIQDSKVLMHNLIQTVGRELVRREDNQPRKRSRLWRYPDVCHAFRCRREEINVEGISLESGGQGDMQLQRNGLTKLRYLRVLILKNLQLSTKFGYPPKTLKYLYWSRCPFKRIPPKFVPQQLVELHLPSSQIEGLWNSRKSRRKGKKNKKLELVNLRVMDLRNCKKLKRTINFRTVPNLEKLRLSGCTGLRKVNRYIDKLNNLVLLDLEGCGGLAKFPKEISGLTSLRNLNLLGCKRLRKLPELGRMERLQELSAGGLDLALLPSTVQSNPLSQSFSLSLRKLHLTDCHVGGAFPFDLRRFTSLESLNLSGNDFVTAPEMDQLSNLEVLSLDNCKRLEIVRDLPANLKTVHMSNCTLLPSLPSLSGLSKLEDLVMEGCKALKKFPIPCEACSSKFLHLNFAGCLKLNDDEMQVSLSWLEMYLKMQMKYKDKRIGELSMVLPRSTIHWLWTDPAIESSFKVSLSSNWFHDTIMGFAIWAVIDVPEPQPHDYGLTGSLIARTMQAQQRPIRERLISVKINIDRAPKDHLWFLYIPCNYSRSIEWWNKFTQFKFKAQFDYFHFKVKKLVFRIIYKQDVDLLQSRNCRKRKRSHDDDSPGDDNFLEFRLNDDDDCPGDDKFRLNDDDDCPGDDNFLEFRLNDFRDDDDEEED